MRLLFEACFEAMSSFSLDTIVPFYTGLLPRKHLIHGGFLRVRSPLRGTLGVMLKKTQRQAS